MEGSLTYSSIRVLVLVRVLVLYSMRNETHHSRTHYRSKNRHYRTGRRVPKCSRNLHRTLRDYLVLLGERAMRACVSLKGTRFGEKKCNIYVYLQDPN